MQDKLSELTNQASAQKPPGDVKVLIKGGESDEELRKLIIQFVLRCPLGETHFHCPFRILAGISYAAMTNLVQAMPRATCLSLFELERECRANYAVKCPPVKKPAD